MRENRDPITRGSSAEARVKAPVAKREGVDAFSGSVEKIIREVQRAGATNLRAIAEALNARGVSTATGKRWEAATVANVLARIEGFRDETDYARLDAMTDDDITNAVADDPDAPPIDIDWTKARLVVPPGKDVITLRLDRDLLDWLRAQGKGYQTLINQVLRAFYDAQIKRAKRQPSAQDPREASWKEVYAAAKKPARKKAAARPAKPAKKRA